MSDVAFPGLAEFSDAQGLGALLWLTLHGPPYLYRLVISDSTVRIEGRWRLLRTALPSRSCAIADLLSAQMRGTLVIIHSSGGVWWSFSTASKGPTILHELEARGVPTSVDP